MALGDVVMKNVWPIFFFIGWLGGWDEMILESCYVTLEN